MSLTPAEDAMLHEIVSYLAERESDMVPATVSEGIRVAINYCHAHLKSTDQLPARTPLAEYIAPLQESESGK